MMILLHKRHTDAYCPNFLILFLNPSLYIYSRILRRLIINNFILSDVVKKNNMIKYVFYDLITQYMYLNSCFMDNAIRVYSLNGESL